MQKVSHLEDKMLRVSFYRLVAKLNRGDYSVSRDGHNAKLSLQSSNNHKKQNL